MLDVVVPPHDGNDVVGRPPIAFVGVVDASPIARNGAADRHGHADDAILVDSGFHGVDVVGRNVVVVVDLVGVGDLIASAGLIAGLIGIVLFHRGARIGEHLVGPVAAAAAVPLSVAVDDMLLAEVHNLLIKDRNGAFDRRDGAESPATATAALVSGGGQPYANLPPIPPIWQALRNWDGNGLRLVCTGIVRHLQPREMLLRHAHDVHVAQLIAEAMGLNHALMVIESLRELRFVLGGENGAWFEVLFAPVDGRKSAVPIARLHALAIRASRRARGHTGGEKTYQERDQQSARSCRVHGGHTGNRRANPPV